MNTMREVEITEVDRSNILVVVKSDPDTRYRLHRSGPGVRWQVHMMTKRGERWVPCDTLLDANVYSNDIIEKIQLNLYSLRS